jgi:membrane protein implicated in regulation of membrane protease activity
VKSSRAWVVYSIIRIAIFAVALAGLLLLQVNPWVATVVAAVIGFCVAYIFFRGTRDEVAKDIYQRRHGEQHDVDNEVENEALDRLEGAQARPDENAQPH